MASRSHGRPRRYQQPERKSEKSWQSDVLKVARLQGWKHYHTHDSRRSNPGFPDLILVRPPRVIAAELKAVDGTVSPDQEEWLTLLSMSGVETYVWRPADMAEVAVILGRKPLPSRLSTVWSPHGTA